MIGVLKRFTGTSSANTAKTVSTEGHSPKRLLRVNIAYSAAPTYTGSGLTVTLNSGAGAGYDCVLQEGTNNERYFSYIPTAPVVLKEDDDIDVVAPAGGGVITSSIEIITEEFKY